MSKAHVPQQGHPEKRTGIGQRLGQDLIRFEYRDGDIYVRRTISKSNLTNFLTNGLDHDSNLGPGVQPVNLADFIHNHYLPQCAAPRLSNPASLQAETALTKALTLTLGTTPSHTIQSSHAESHKARRLAQGRANNSVKKELRCLGRIMDFAVSMGLVKKNLLSSVRGLPSADRSWIWLRLPQIGRLIESCPDRIRLLVEFMILTGARIGEALLVQDGDVKWDRGGILIPTEKRKCPPRESMRALKIESLGPRFAALLPKLKPDAASGRYFPMSPYVVNDNFIVARKKAGLDIAFPGVAFHVHDLRGTFCVHRAMVVQSFRQLQYELGHRDAKSVQSYLDRAQEFEPSDSIFFNPQTPQPPLPATTAWATPDMPGPDYPARNLLH